MVVALQQLLTATSFYRGDIDGIYGPRTRSAVVAVHKALDLPRTSAWQLSDWYRLRAFPGPRLPRRDGEVERLEIDLNRQLLYLLSMDQVMAIIPISTGNCARYQNETGQWVRAITPPGNFYFYRHYDGWKTSYLGDLYRPWYFAGGYALHGSRQVPSEPASHGCVRVSLWDADYLAESLWIGMPLHIWNRCDEIEQPAADRNHSCHGALDW